ncbi:MAG: replication protein, partial [Ignavibacteria bacterium]|nr:replication protein [Ignavibacteria bacterium]
MNTIEGNYTKTPNEIFEAIISGNFKATHYKILLTIIRYTCGFNREDHSFSVSFLSRAMNVSRRYISQELQDLIEKRVVVVTKSYTVKNSRKLKINENIDEWIGYGTTVLQVSHSSTGEPHIITTDEPQFHSRVEPQFTQERKVFKDNIKEKSILEKISFFRGRYDDFQLEIVDEFIAIIKSTRKNNKVADTVILKIYQELDKYE